MLLLQKQVKLGLGISGYRISNIVQLLLCENIKACIKILTDYM